MSLHQLWTFLWPSSATCCSPCSCWLPSRSSSRHSYSSTLWCSRRACLRRSLSSPLLSSTSTCERFLAALRVCAFLGSRSSRCYLSTRDFLAIWQVHCNIKQFIALRCTQYSISNIKHPTRLMSSFIWRDLIWKYTMNSQITHSLLVAAIHQCIHYRFSTSEKIWKSERISQQIGTISLVWQGNQAEPGRDDPSKATECHLASP